MSVLGFLFQGGGIFRQFVRSFLVTLFLFCVKYTKICRLSHVWEYNFSNENQLINWSYLNGARFSFSVLLDQVQRLLSQKLQKKTWKSVNGHNWSSLETIKDNHAKIKMAWSPYLQLPLLKIQAGRELLMFRSPTPTQRWSKRCLGRSDGHPPHSRM